MCAYSLVETSVYAMYRFIQWMILCTEDIWKYLSWKNCPKRTLREDL